MKRILRFLGAAVSGVALAMCFVPFDQAWLVWGWMWILLPLLWTARRGEPSSGKEKGRIRRLFGRVFRARSTRAFMLAWIAGMAFWVINLKWLWTVTMPGALVLGAYLSIYFGIFGIFAVGPANPWRKSFRATKTIRDRIQESTRSLGYAVLLGGFWCGLEWLRGWVLTGFGWNGLGVAFANHLVLAQGAEFVGVTGLAFLPVFMSAAAVQTARRFYLQFRAHEVKMLHWDFASALVVIMLAFTVGTIRLSSATNTSKIEGRVLLVQQDIPQVAGDISWEPDEIVNGFQELVTEALREVDEQTAKQLMEAGEEKPGEDVMGTIGTPDLLVLPEACLPGWLWQNDDAPSSGSPFMEDMLAWFSQQRDWTFVSGINEVRGEEFEDPETEIYNSLLIDGGPLERQTYQKTHLVILGEYFPRLPYLAELYEWQTDTKLPRNMSVGQNFEPLEIELGGRKVGVIPSICFEDTLGRVTRRPVRNESQIILNVTNDGWFQKSEGSLHHFRNALFRCIELRRPMVRSANRGVTGVVSVTGSLTDPFTGERRSLVDENGGPFQRGYLLASVYVPVEGQVTVYAAFGDWFAAGGLGLGLLWSVFALIRRKLNTAEAVT